MSSRFFLRSGYPPLSQGRANQQYRLGRFFWLLNAKPVAPSLHLDGDRGQCFRQRIVGLVGIGDDDAPPIAEGDVFRDSEHHGVAKNVALYDVACNSNPIAFNAESVVSCGSESTERRHS